IVQQPHRVGAGEGDLLDSELQAGHGFPLWTGDRGTPLPTSFPARGWGTRTSVATRGARAPTRFTPCEPSHVNPPTPASLASDGERHLQVGQPSRARAAHQPHDLHGRPGRAALPAGELE